MAAPALSVVVPAYDEAAGVATTLRSLHDTLGGLGIAHEIILVDNASRDGTADVVEALGERTVRVLEDAGASLLTDRRRHAPRGVNGGDDGRTGVNRLNDGLLPAKVDVELSPGDMVGVVTPGGGGWGAPRGRAPRKERRNVPRK